MKLLLARIGWVLFLFCFLSDLIFYNRVMKLNLVGGFISLILSILQKVWSAQFLDT